MLVYPNAKINIGLNVVARRPDGYHDLETVFYPIDLHDALEVQVMEDDSLSQGKVYELKVNGAILGGMPDDNLVVRALQLLRRDFPQQIRPVSIHLLKHIPTGAGLGGGSADAAFMLTLINTRFNLGLSVIQLEDYAAQLGADCAFFVRNTAVFAQGVGNIFSPIHLNLTGKWIVLVKPDISVSTSEAYRHVQPRCPEQGLQQLLSLPVDQWKGCVVNDFEASVFPLYPEIAAIKDRLYDLGALYASMSGSGSAVYGIFDTQVEHVDEVFAGYFCRQRRM